MKVCKHLVENRIYLISGKTIEGIKAFRASSEKRNFKRKIVHYLGEISDILHIEIYPHEFHILIRIKERNSLEEFFQDKHKGRVKENFFIPESTYIFGRQMSNLQVSFVKTYNWKFKRKGTLIDGRYRRQIIESEEEIDKIISLLKSGDYRMGESLDSKKTEEAGSVDGEKKVFNEGLFSEMDGLTPDLRGCFLPPFKTDLIPEYLAQKMKIFRISHPCGPNYN